MKKIIFVNATACTSGGVLSILNQFIDNISRYNKEYIYYIFSTVKRVTNDKNIIFISDIRGKKFLDRIIWDSFGMKEWAIKNNIKPDLIISLQNTGVRFRGVEQIVYLHQSLPYAKESKWSLFKSDERRLWLYKNIYKLWIDFTVKKHTMVVVQTKWMKEALINIGYNREKIIVSKPSINNININEINPMKYKEKFLFYPAADYKYKNHIILIEAVKFIVEKRNLKFDKFKIILTLSKESRAFKKVIQYGLSDYFEFIGEISYEKVLSYYKGCNALLFPSYIETVGLPLIEASIFGKKILVADCEYSREILYDYKLATFISYYESEKWGNAIGELLSKYEETKKTFKHKNGWEDVFNLIDTIFA